MKKKSYYLSGLIFIVLAVSGCKKEEIILQVPEVTTFSVTEIDYQSASCGGSVNSAGLEITARGICWSTKPSPTISDSISTDEDKNDSFTISLKNLKPDSTYYVRAFATNSAGTGYGSIMKFKTKHASINVVTATLSDVSYQSATCGGSVTCEGTSITACGICWSTSATPTLADSITVDGHEAGSFTSSLRSLKPDLIYNVRAYATNGIDTIYGSIMKFKTKRASISVATTTVSMIFTNSATIGGIVSASSGTTIVSRGVCWSLSPYPTIEDYSSTVTSSANSFSSTLKDLKPNTLYYARAYGSSYNELIYGDNIIFKTRQTVLSVTPPSFSNLKSTTVEYKGTVTSERPELITARGACWSSTNNNPTIADNKSSVGVGNGTFSSSITGLKSNTTYYVRTYVTDNEGTVYSDVMTFKTAEGPTEGAPIVSTVAITRNGTSLYIEGQILYEGNSVVTRYGYCCSTSPNPTLSTSFTSAYNTGTISTYTMPMFLELTIGKTYFIRAYAVNNIGIGYGNVIEYVY